MGKATEAHDEKKKKFIAGSQYRSSHPWQRSCGEDLTCKGESELKGPPWTCPSIYPKTKICLFYYFTTFTNSSDIKGGAIPDHLSLKKINLELYLISLLGIIGVFQFKALWWLSSLPDRFVRTPAATHVIAHSLPTRRGMGSLRYSNNTELLRELKLLE